MTLAVMWLVGLLCMKSKKATARSMVVMVLLFTIGITICFAAAMSGHSRSGMTMSPSFIPETSAFRQIVRIAFVSPWAFIGFETVSHSAAENNFKHSNMFRVLVISVAVTTALYIFVILLSVSAYPESCSSWLVYIRNLDEFEGISGLPAFYAAHYYLGPTGINILMVSLMSLVLTSLIGMLRALSRLCYAVAQDSILPECFYGFASVAVFKTSGQEGEKRDRLISGISLLVLAAFAVFLLFPSVFSDYTLATETYVLMAAWSLFGLLYFHRVIRKDHARHFGKAIIVWLALLAFIVLMAMTWAERLNEDRENAIIAEISDYIDGTVDPAILEKDKDEFLAEQLSRLHDADNTSVFVIVGLFGLSLVVMLSNYLTMQKWEKQANEERDEARNVALTDPLTGVKSKHAFLLNQKKIDASIDEGTADEFAVAVCDVNGLKYINDTLGHKAGDEYILKASRMICDIFQHSPVYRIGGDEFAVILHGRDYLLKKELLLALHDRSVEHIRTNEVVISGGLSDYKLGLDRCFHDVFERADALMYKEKKLLKGMGTISREDAEVAARPVYPTDEDADI